jgi:hypothetical protein
MDKLKCRRPSILDRVVVSAGRDAPTQVEVGTTWQPSEIHPNDTRGCNGEDTKPHTWLSRNRVPWRLGHRVMSNVAFYKFDTRATAFAVFRYTLSCKPTAAGIARAIRLFLYIHHSFPLSAALNLRQACRKAQSPFLQRRYHEGDSPLVERQCKEKSHI